MVRATLGSLAVLLSLGLAAPAAAADPTPPAPAKEAPRVRRLGFGFASGVALGAPLGLGQPRVAFVLPTLEGRVFLAQERSLDLSFSPLDLAISAARGGLNLRLDAFLDFNFGGPTRLLLGPGFGLSVSGRALAWVVEVRVPAVVGVEFLTAGRELGVSLQARPFVELVLSGAPAFFAAGGSLVVAVNWYATREAP